MQKTIIKFWGNGCTNCKALAPILEMVKNEYKDIAFKEVNIHDHEDVARRYEVTTIPTLVYEADGTEVGRLMGLKPKSLIIKKIDEVFK